MQVTKASREIIRWDIKGMGLFEATIWDGRITDVRMHRQGSNLDGERLWASNGCEEFLRVVHNALGDLLDHLDK